MARMINILGGGISIYAPSINELWLDLEHTVGKAQRDKGRRGQSAAEKLLRDRDWTTVAVTAGIKSEDIVATDPHGQQWSVEVKNCADITAAHRSQAMTQARVRKLKWMLMNHIIGTNSWLIQRQGMKPTIWHEKDSLI